MTLSNNAPAIEIVCASCASPCDDDLHDARGVVCYGCWEERRDAARYEAGRRELRTGRYEEPTY